MGTSTRSARDRLIAFAEYLLVQTQAGNVEWSSADETDKVFVYSGPNSSVVIKPKTVGDRETSELQLINDRGSVVTVLRGGWGDRQNPISRDTPYPWNALLIGLYEESRRVALNVDEVMDDISSSIGGGDSQSTAGN